MTQVKPLRVALTSLSLCLGDSKKADWHQKGKLLSQSRNVSKVDKAISKGDRHFHFFAADVVSERIQEGFGLSPLSLWAEGLVEVVVQGLHDGTEVFQVIPHLGMHFEVSRLLLFVTHLFQHSSENLISCEVLYDYLFGEAVDSARWLVRCRLVLSDHHRQVVISHELPVFFCYFKGAVVP